MSLVNLKEIASPHQVTPTRARAIAYEIIVAANTAQTPGIGTEYRRAWGFIANYIRSNIDDIESMLLGSCDEPDPDDETMLRYIDEILDDWKVVIDP
jgi:hypothetical protein